MNALSNSFMNEQDIDLQRRRTGDNDFKNHFIAGLCSTDKNFPMYLWDRLLPQAILTLNLLRGSQINPNYLRTLESMEFFYSNRTPIAPPGIRVLVHDKPSQRRSWSPYTSDARYVGPAFDSYRCYLTWMVATRALCISDTVAWFPSKVTIPTSSSVDLVIAGAKDIVQALHNPSPGSLLAPLVDSEVAVLKTLSDILLNRGDHAQSKQTPVPTPTVPPSFDSLPRVDPPLSDVPRVAPPGQEVLRVDPMPTAPRFSDQTSSAERVRFAPSVSTIDMSTLMSHDKHPRAATEEPTYADHTATVARRRRQTKKNARATTRKRITATATTRKSSAATDNRGQYKTGRKSAPRNRAKATPPTTRAKCRPPKENPKSS
jgi:hypothetical protein